METITNLKYPVVLYTSKQTDSNNTENENKNEITFGKHKGVITLKFNKDLCIFAEDLILLLTQYNNIKDLRSLCPDIVNNKLKELTPNVMVS